MLSGGFFVPYCDIDGAPPATFSAYSILLIPGFDPGYSAVWPP